MFITDGASAKEKAIVDMLLDTAMDFRNGTVRQVYNKDYVSVLSALKII